MAPPLIIDSKVANKFLETHENELIKLAAKITAEAAESLSMHEGWLVLNGLTELTDAAAESLSKHKGGLDLDGLTELSDAAAESLSKHEGDLRLNGLTELSDVAAESLSKHEGEICFEEPEDWVTSLREE